MKLWKISQGKNNGYDTFDEAVVVAETEYEARRMHPQNGKDIATADMLHEWVTDPADVTAEYIGEARGNVEKRVVCASFHAG